LIATVQRSFYITVGTFAVSYALYRVHKSGQESGSESWLSRLITNWTPSEKTFEQRNAIHTVAMEKAAHDRHLFQSQGPAEAIDLNHPECVVLVPVGGLRGLTYAFS
jgi:hypothetical protein